MKIIQQGGRRESDGGKQRIERVKNEEGMKEG